MQEKKSPPWWKFGHMWLVVGGPAVVVVASFITLYLAIMSPNPVIDVQAEAQQAQARVAAPVAGPMPNMAPAMQARNHAATGVPAPAKP
ncbi:MAG: nitrogen fixation protein FixH [Polaromonas sp.]|jgi:hypothetical protein|nr:nitrogen fixation protein FixH [Polaromonas sp.]